jgi:hypothetical protein
MVHGDEVGACGEGALDHEFGERSDDGGLDMAATEHGLAHGHEVRDHVLAIANELYAFRKRTIRSCARNQGAYFLQVVCDQSLSFVSTD